MTANGCICPRMERALRAWRAKADMPPMTAEQRECCLEEIGSVEGFDRADHEDEDDDLLACTTIGAWIDYCRDKGLM